MLTFSSGIMGAAAGAVATGLVSSSATALYTHKGRLDRAAKDVFSEANVRNLALGAVSAGACAGITNHFKIAGLTDASGNTLKGSAMHVRIAQQHAIRGVVNSAVYQQNIGKSMEHEVGSAAMASGQNLVGETVAADSHVTKGAFHAGFGGLVAKAQNRSVASGVIAGATAEMVATASESLAGKAQEVALASTGAIAGGITLAAGGDRKDITFSSATANSAIMYNHEAHRVKVHGLEEKKAELEKEKIFFDDVVLDEVQKDASLQQNFTAEEMDAIKVGVVLPSVHQKIATELTKDMAPSVALGIAATPFVAGVGAIIGGATLVEGIGLLASRIAARFSASGKNVIQNPIYLKYKSGSHAQGFNKKIDALQSLAKQGKLKKTTNTHRDANLTRDYRKNVLDKADRQFGKQNPDFVRKIEARLEECLDADHTHELQLGGKDATNNLKLLDRSVNRSIGIQIKNQIALLPEGATITAIIIKK